MIPAMKPNKKCSVGVRLSPDILVSLDSIGHLIAAVDDKIVEDCIVGQGHNTPVSKDTVRLEKISHTDQFIIRVEDGVVGQGYVPAWKEGYNNS